MMNIPQQQAVDTFEQTYAEVRRSQRLRSIIAGSIFVAAIIASAHIGEVSITSFIEGLPGFGNYLSDISPPIRSAHFFADIAEWYWGFWRWLGLLWDTVLIAFLGTLLGFIAAILLCFSASHNLMQNRWGYFFSRRATEIARGVPELVYAMIFVFSFGIGPFAGVLAIAVHTAGALGKLFSEVNENIDHNTLDGVKAAGANWIQTIRFAVIPQVLPNYASYTLMRFEINVRSASIIGFVGAGGIGQELMFVIRQFIYVDISALVFLILVCVSVIDISCEKFRHHMIGKGLMS